jgi:hypothetical protein
MSLFDALLLDEYSDPKDRYVAARSDHLFGSGTLSDPWDSSVVPGLTQPLSALSFDVKLVIAITGSDHPYNSGETVLITLERGPNAGPYTTSFSITKISARAFSFLLAADPTAPASGLCSFRSERTSGSPTSPIVVRLFWPVAVATAAAHGLVEFDAVSVTGAADASFNGSFVALGISSNAFHYLLPGKPIAAAGSSMTFARLQHRFDAALTRVPANSLIQLGVAAPNNPIRTRGLCSVYVSDPSDTDKLYVGCSVKSGQTILGSGIETTSVKLEMAVDQVTMTTALGSFKELLGFTASDFSVDCNLPDQPIPYEGYFAPVTTGATGPLRGSHNRLRRIRATRFGTQSLPECFVMALHGWSDVSKNLVISDCMVEKPGSNPFHESTLMIASPIENAPSSSLKSTGNGAVVRRCYADCRYPTGFSTQRVEITAITTPPNASGLFDVTTKSPHNRVAGDNIVISGVSNLTVPQTSHPYNSSFRVVLKVSELQVTCQMVFPPSPFPTPGFANTKTLGVDYHSPEAIGGTGSTVESNSAFDCTIPIYNDTGVSRDTLVRDGYYSDCQYGVWMNFGVGGQDTLAKASGIVQVSGDPFLAEFTVAAGTTHNLSIGNIVFVQGARTSAVPPTNNPYNGNFLVEDVPSNTKFRYRMSANPGGPADPPTTDFPIQFSGRWDTRRLVIERNQFDLYSVDVNSGIFPRGALGDGELVVAPFLFNQWIIRENLIRHVDGKVSTSDVSKGTRVKGVNGLLIQENLVDVESPTPLEHLNSENVVPFNNQRMSGVPVRETDVTVPATPQKVGELSSQIEDVVMMALF